MSNESPSPAPTFKGRIAEAWRMHRDAQHDAAAKAFEALLKEAPDDVDVNYGLGLSLRAIEQNEAAITAFRKAYDQSVARLNELRAESANREHLASENLQTTEDDRYAMLTRMTHQRLKEMGIDVPPVVEII